MPNRSYFTTTLPYVNAAPHLGFAFELVAVDTVARAARLIGEEVFLNTGTDEHGLKILRTAKGKGLAPQVYVDQASEKFRQLLPALNISAGANFIRTTDSAHAAAAQEFWRRAEAAGDIYKKEYQIKYCVGCELEKTESELVPPAAGLIGSRCPLHPNQDLELIAEENYFFRFSKYQKPLLDFYAEHSDFVVPETRFRELRAFVERGLEDFSISRLATKQPWGVPVPASSADGPNDSNHTMYVWFDALVNYVSAIGWPVSSAGGPSNFEKWWPPIQFAGKDNLRQQAAMWQAMLLSVGLPPSRQIVIHGFITSAGQKMSKSLGNVIDPFALIQEYGADAVRYYLLRHIHPFEDSDFTLEKFKLAYNAGLANGLGNLVSRVLTMSRMSRRRLDMTKATLFVSSPFPAELDNFLSNYEFNRALDFIWRKIEMCDQFIQEAKPFALIKTEPKQAKTDIEHLIGELWQIACWLEPFLPATAATIKHLVQTARPPATPLFPRK